MRGRGVPPGSPAAVSSGIAGDGGGAAGGGAPSARSASATDRWTKGELVGSSETSAGTTCLSSAAPRSWARAASASEPGSPAPFDFAAISLCRACSAAASEAVATEGSFASDEAASATT